MIWINFVGEGRSGHTVLSGALGSHLHIRLAEEQKYIYKSRREGFDREAVMEHLYQSGGGKARQAQGWPNLKVWKEPLEAVGDKCGWDAVNEYRKRGAPANVIEEFSQFIDMPVKTIVTVRHPLDNLVAWIDSPKYKRLYSDDELRFRRMIRRYKRFYEAAWEILQYTDYKIIYNEELIANPSEVLQDLTDWLGLPPNREWRRASAKRIWKEPHQRRHDIEWPQEYVDRVNAFIEVNPLMGYYR